MEYLYSLFLAKQEIIIKLFNHTNMQFTYNIKFGSNVFIGDISMNNEIKTQEYFPIDVVAIIGIFKLEITIKPDEVCTINIYDDAIEYKIQNNKNSLPDKLIYIDSLA